MSAKQTIMTDLNFIVFHTINDMAGKNLILDSAMIFVANYLISIFAIYLLYMWFAKSKCRQEVLFAGYAALIGLWINSIIGLFYFHSRPFIIHTGTLLILHDSTTSFPSNHATLMFSVSLMFLAFKELRRSGVILFILSLIIGLARVYTGVHFPIDIAGSLVVALFSVCIVPFSKKYLIPINSFLIGNFDKYRKKLTKSNIRKS